MTQSELAANGVMHDAIERSIRENSIVHIGYDDNRGGYVESAFESHADTEGDAETGTEHEFWGRTEAGAEWRVHVLTQDVD